ncbi:malto-oligosyltrehalose trehalohydrolase [Pendulispora brunnea]|uniref:Malto-oligosyltrehalose trehalohydrolase n=1 Tax=Pendulispora brunnea TaxID=2905690 RepID=A0ABZ2KQV5_9BACT
MTVQLGAAIEGAGTRFRAFVTTSPTCAVRLYDGAGNLIAEHAMTALGDGHFEIVLEGAGHGTLYRYRVGDRDLPDPYARYLPQGVHGPAMVVDSTHAWRHGVGGARPLEEQVIYELHVGTFTPEGTYEAARQRLRDLVDLGVTTVELMPLAAFPGQRGWGYDGVALYAPFAPYGTPYELRRFIDEAHGHGLNVLLDVVYNHFGPSGNYLSAYSEQYFNADIRTAWGDAPDFSHAAMRRYVLDNARYWLTEFHFDGLRLDAVHAIVDDGPYPILRELSDMVAALEPRKVLIAEDERNDPAIVTTLGMNGVWADDFHHQVRTTLTGERDGYYGAYTPGISGIAETIDRGWLYQGEFYAPKGKPRGKPAGALPAQALVYCIQNHDQIGNRALGDRLTESISLDAYCAASTLLLLLPMTPLLFMGQEWAASTPFLFFTDHEEPLGRAVSEGRRNEFKSFSSFANFPDPQDPTTFERSRLRWPERHEAPHARVLDLYRKLLRLRREDPVFRHGSRERLRASTEAGFLIVHQWRDAEQRHLLVNFDGIAKPLPDAFRGRTASFTSGEPLERERIPASTAVVVV